jgi:hypothetical protein
MQTDNPQKHGWARLAAGLETPPLEGERLRTILAVQTDPLATLLQAGDPVAPAGDGGAGKCCSRMKRTPFSSPYEPA